MDLKYDSILMAITTKYLGPTNYRGARIVAEVNGFRAIVPYSHEDRYEDHARAVRALLDKIGWSKTYEGCTLHAAAMTDGRLVWSFLPTV